MAIEKITNPITANFLINKVNDIIDNKQDTLTPGTGINITNDVIGVDSEQVNEITLATVATSGDYDDLSNKPTIPTVNNATLTITQGGVSKGTFTANSAVDATIALDGAAYDNSTINENASNQLQAIAVKNARSSSDNVPVWNGNEIQYNTGETIPFYAWQRQAEGFIETQVSQYNVPYTCIASGDGVLIALSREGTLFQVYDDSLDTWTPHYTLSSSGCADDIAFGEGEFVAVGPSGCIHCPANDIDLWEDSTTDISGFTDYRIAYFEPSGVPTFVCVDMAGHIYVSTNKGVTWSNPTNFPTVDWLDNDQYVADIAAYGENLVIIKKNGMVYETTDLASWTATDLSQEGYEGNYPNLFTAIEYIPWGAGYFLAVTAYGNMAHNKNGYWIFYQPLDSSAYDFKKIASGGDDGVDEETGEFIPNIEIISRNGKIIKYRPAYGDWEELPQISHSPCYSITYFVEDEGFFVAGTDYISGEGTIKSYWYSTTAIPSQGDYLYSQPSKSAAITDDQYRVQAYNSGNNTITLNNGEALGYDSAHNTTGAASVADVHPEYLCFIDAVGVKRNDIFVANYINITVDQTYDGTSANAQSGVAIAGVLGNIETLLSQI